MAASIRLFVEAPLHAEARIAATPAQAHYLLRVMRRRAGEVVLLFNGRDGEWSAAVAPGERGVVALAVEGRTRAQTAPPGGHLLFAPLRRDATDLVVQKATELGIGRIMPVLTRHGRGERVNLDRLRAIAVEAAEQSERLSVPLLDAPETLSALLARWPAARPLHAAIERSGAPAPRRQGEDWGLLVGPEGGFAADERARLAAHAAVRWVGLGPTVLRAETAAIAGLALLLL